MVMDVKFGDNVDDLLVLLNIPNDKEDILWEHGFDLDDMDWWMAIPKHYNETTRMYWNEITTKTYYKTSDYYHHHPIEYDETEFKYDWDACPYWLQRQFDMMDSYCVGFRWGQFGDYDVFTVHHS